MNNPPSPSQTTNILSPDSFSHIIHTPPFPTVLDSFEAICIQSNIKIPLDLVAQGKAELDDDALIATFGAQFCESHRLLQAHKGKSGWFY